MPYHRNEMDRFINNFTRDFLAPVQSFESLFSIIGQCDFHCPVFKQFPNPFLTWNQKLHDIGLTAQYHTILSPGCAL